MTPDLAGLLKEFSALPAADRKAILKRLSSTERKSLQKARREKDIDLNLRALAACSPRLAKQLTPLVQSESVSHRLGVSNVAREALLKALTAPLKASNRQPSHARESGERAQ